MTRPEAARIETGRAQQSFDTRLAEMRRMLARARPEQIRRLMDDIRNCTSSDDPRGTA